MSAASLAKLTKEARESFLPCEIKSPACAVLSQKDMFFHHRKLRSAGGTDGRDNLLWTDPYCHTFVHANPSVSYERGWLLHSWEEVA